MGILSTNASEHKAFIRAARIIDRGPSLEKSCFIGLERGATTILSRIFSENLLSIPYRQLSNGVLQIHGDAELIADTANKLPQTGITQFSLFVPRGSSGAKNAYASGVRYLRRLFEKIGPETNSQDDPCVRFLRVFPNVLTNVGAPPFLLDASTRYISFSGGYAVG